MKADVVLVTPEMATDILENNNNKNRPIKLASVESLTDLMIKGLYKENGESIIFSETGRLLDGQHRLQAVIKSGKAFNFVVVSGVPDPYFDTIDIGKPRSVGDILGIIGQKGGNDVAAVARLAMLFEEKGNVDRSGRQVLSPKEVAEYIYENPYLYDLTEQVRKGKGPLTAAPLAAVLYLGNQTRQWDKEVVEFLSYTKTGEGLKSGNPILPLREWIINEKTKSHSIIPKEVAFELIAKVWSLWMERKSLTVLKPKNILGKPVEIFGFTSFKDGDRVTLRTRPSQEPPKASVSPPSAP